MQPWLSQYKTADKHGPVERRAIIDGDEEIETQAVVEVRLKSFKVLAFPDKHMQFTKPMTVYVSRAESLNKFTGKIKRVLANQANNIVKSTKQNPCKDKLRLWCCSKDEEYLMGLDKLYECNNEVNIEATPLVPFTGKYEI